MAVAVVLATCLVLAGCSADPTGSDAGGLTSTAPDSSPDAPGSPDKSPDKGSGKGSGKGSASTRSVEDGDDDRFPDEQIGTAQPDATPDDGISTGIEIPAVPEDTEPRLSELFDEQRSTPLVTAPLPRADSASGRLVEGFPSVLRPVPASAVLSSSVSPAGARLQVGLVVSTSRSSTAVLRAYRARLNGRGMKELDAPLAAAGAQTAAFGRGLSRVTLTVTPDGARTSYIVQAVLHTGRD